MAAISTHFSGYLITSWQWPGSAWQCGCCRGQDRRCCCCKIIITFGLIEMAMNVSRDFYKFVKRCILCSTLKKQKTCTVFLSSFNIYILAFYHECRFVIGYATIYSVIDSEQRSCVIQRPLLAVFEESVKRIQISKVLNNQQIYTKTIRLFALDLTVHR